MEKSEPFVNNSGNGQRPRGLAFHGQRCAER
jgi:hypothetical protein